MLTATRAHGFPGAHGGAARHGRYFRATDLFSTTLAYAAGKKAALVMPGAYVAFLDEGIFVSGDGVETWRVNEPPAAWWPLAPVEDHRTLQYVRSCFRFVDV